MEKYIIVLDQLYRCFILRGLNNALWKEKGSKKKHQDNECRNTCCSYPLLSRRDFAKMRPNQKEMVDVLKIQQKKRAIPLFLL
jgi:isopentenyldiphosphate isomerase